MELSTPNSIAKKNLDFDVGDIPVVGQLCGDSVERYTKSVRNPLMRPETLQRRGPGERTEMLPCKVSTVGSFLDHDQSEGAFRVNWHMFLDKNSEVSLKANLLEFEAMTS